ncbi:PH domain-like protein [Backusella circina FSU 941]|nr:PH domain-like protein [Backusella circina FSU 941]
MSSPTGSINEADFIEDGSLNKKRGRAQSQEPVALVKEDEQVEEKSTTVSAPKKTKRDEEASTVSTIRKNMKDMTTTDKTSEGGNSHDGDEQMGAIDEEEDDDIEEDQEPPTASALAQFGGNSKNDDDWGEFAQDDEEEEAEKPKEDLNKSKYTFGASSGFGTKGWAVSHQTMPTPSKQPTFGGFGSSSGFGGFKASPSPFTDSNTNTKSIPSFSSFAKATTSPFAAAAAAGSNALSPNSTSVTSPGAEDNNKESDNENDHDNKEKAADTTPSTTTTTTTTTTFGETAKVKVPGVKETKVTTGEENEDTICQTKGKLYVMDNTQNWKERGVGTFRLNKHENESRLVMRTDSVYRLILNLKLFPGMKIFIMQDKFIRFGTLETETNEDGTSETKLVNYALKLGSASTAQEICQHIISCIPPPSSSPSSPNES